MTYTHCDLSISYPVSRGTGLTLIAMAGIVLLEEEVSLQARGAIAIIILGIVVAHVRTGARIAE